MADINFERIAARSGSQRDAFEELSCQLAARTCGPSDRFQRIHGAGGDGGVECLAHRVDGTCAGWQAKYVFDIDALIAQADESLKTALGVHRNLSAYYVCFPFNLTGPTKRKGKSQREKFDAWAAKAIAAAREKNRTLTIEAWPASKLQSLLLQHDAPGGIRYFFFNEPTLSHEWFERHVTTASTSVGPRYTRNLNVDTPLWSWLESFAQGNAWREQLEEHVVACFHKTRELREHIEDKREGPMSPDWPAQADPLAQDALKNADAVVTNSRGLIAAPSAVGRRTLRKLLSDLLVILDQLEQILAEDFNAKHGKGRSESKQFRQFQAEYMVSFPAANLDNVREAKTKFREFESWIDSPTGFLAFERAFLLSGPGGAGKTHGLCDAAVKRLESRRYSCIVFGHQFNGQPDPWTRLAESLGLPVTLGKDGLLDALNAAGEASGAPALLLVDAVNETSPRNYWLNQYLAFVQEIERRAFLKVCVTCRTSFLSVCIPANVAQPIVEHQGFVGLEREACNAFFAHHELEPPLVPILQPELSNPLYLKLVCQTLQLRGLKRLPSGWHGLTPVIQAFLEEKEKQFATEHHTSIGAAVVRCSLFAIASEIAQSGNAALPWSKAVQVVSTKCPQSGTLPVIDWLVRADLLLEDGSPISGPLGGELVLRPAFERFGDFLIASDLLTRKAPAQEFGAGGRIEPLVVDAKAVAANSGVLTALSVLVPERHPSIEIPDLIADLGAREAVLVLTVEALPWRTPDSYTSATARLVQEALASSEGWNALEKLLSVATHRSDIDAFWLDALLAAIPMAKRDAFLAPYLADRFEGSGVVKRLIEASSGFPLDALDVEVAKRWSILLIWFSSAPDRRVKGNAIRAAVAVLRAKPAAILSVVQRFIASDDDEVRENTLLSAYGALLLSHDRVATKSVAEHLLNSYQRGPTSFQNALIRDDIRCIAELARQMGWLDARFDPSIPSNRRSSDWPLALPTEAEVKDWRDDAILPKIHTSCLDDDFNHYSINCLGPWFTALDKPGIGKWVLKRIVDEFSYIGSGCERYDRWLLQKHGGGRSKPVWAERIGKKYQWAALYQLASRLYDNVASKKDSSTPAGVAQRLILQEERKIDPTLPRTMSPDVVWTERWWLQSVPDLRKTNHLDDDTWIATEVDMVDIAKLLSPIARDGRQWLLLTSFASWNNKPKEASWREPYRDTWIHLRGYLVPKEMLARARRQLTGRNFWQDWMPDGASWSKVFAGEYPWATAFNSETDQWHGYQEFVYGSDLPFVHASNEIVAEWEYDGALPRKVHFRVPARKFFEAGTLRWDGRDGFCTDDGTAVFRDPCLTDGGPTSLISDFDDLRQRLDKLGLRLIWTIIGEKRTLAGETERRPQVSFSQIAYLNEDGTVTVGKRTYFTNYEEKQGLGK